MSAPRRAWIAWALPVGLAAGAVALHFAINVPRGPYEQRPPRKSKRAKPKKDGGGFRARPPARLEELRRQYAQVPFDAEPVDEAFARAHEGVVSKAVAVARADAYRGAPEPPNVDTSVVCHTLRCRVDACSRFPPELDLLAASMMSLRLKDAQLFHQVDVEPTTWGALGREPEGQPCFRIVVSFTHDLPPRDEIAVPKSPPG